MHARTHALACVYQFKTLSKSLFSRFETLLCISFQIKLKNKLKIQPFVNP